VYIERKEDVISQQLENMELRLLKLQSNAKDKESAALVPLYRFLILPGHEFQNYPSDFIKVQKPKVEPPPKQLEQNFVKWILSKSNKPTKQFSNNNVHYHFRHQSTKDVAVQQP